MRAERSPIVALCVQVATPFAIVVGTYLLFAGHNNPGGGFAAGLVFGAIVVLRTIAGFSRPSDATMLIAGGVALVAAVATAPLLWGDTFLDQELFSVTLPALGKVKSGSALPFDIGVTAIVVGLIVSLLDGFDIDALSKTPGGTSEGASRS